MKIIGTFATESAQKDLEIFLGSLALLYKGSIRVYLFVDEFIYNYVETNTYPFEVIQTKCLNKYGGLTRKQMERIRGTYYKTLWGDLMGEKMNILDLIFKTDPGAETHGVFLVDSDLCFFSPLPEIPSQIRLALSPHYIDSRSTTLYGNYNGGFVFTRDPEFAAKWKHEALFNSRFFEQTALEQLAIEYDDRGEHLDLPLQVNYGWWRMYQSVNPVVKQQADFKIIDNTLVVVDAPLQSVHTHFGESSQFNSFILEKAAAVSSLEPLVSLIKKVSGH